MKKISLLTFICIAYLCSYSQKFMHGAGVIILVDKSEYSDANAVGGLTYSPRFNFFQKDNISLSVGIPLSVGLGGSYNSHYGSYSSESNNIRFMFNLPAVVNFNFGRGASRNAHSRMGFFAGAGYGYHYSSENDSYSGYFGEYSDNDHSSTTGPVANAGLRIGVGRVHNIEIKLSYMKGTTDSKPDIYSIATLFNF
jgi:outer membrane protein W